MKLGHAAAVAGVSGLLALSWEILWYRLISFITGGPASAFGVLLASYLCGLAFGSLWVRRACGDGEPTPAQLRLPSILALAAALMAWAVAPVAARLVTVGPWPLVLPLIAVAAGLQGAILPLVAHLGIAPDAKAGARLSWIYLANIVGSTLGSLITGFVLLDILNFAQVSSLLGVVGTGLALALAWLAPMPSRFVLAGAAQATAVLVAVLHGPAFGQFWERLQLKKDYSGQHFPHVVETRSGVITVNDNGGIYGGGVYDGVFNIDLVNDRNRILRPALILAMHPQPKRILVIGLASGSWTQLLANMPGVEDITAIEINPGYLELIGRFPQVASLLKNPKVHIVIDDGRRWLEAHPTEKFDVVVQNTSFHWRGHSTNLLRIEYLQMVGLHLGTGGLFIWNTTDSIHAQKAGCLAFADALRFDNHMAASNRPIVLNPKRFTEKIQQIRIEGRPLLDTSVPEHAKRLAEIQRLISEMPNGRTAYFERCPSVLDKCKDGPPVTEDNMVSEFARSWWSIPD